MKNQKFETFLKALPNNAGIAIYFIETAIGTFTYNQLDGKFYVIHDHNGYRKYSLTSLSELSQLQSSELEEIIIENKFIFTEESSKLDYRRILYNGFKMEAACS